MRFLSSSMILASISWPTYGSRSRTRRSSTSDAGRKPRRPMSTIRPPFTTSITGPLTTPSDSLISSILPHARSYWARFLERMSRPSASSFWRTSASISSPSETISDGSTSLRIESSLDGDDALGLVPDVEQHLVLVDLDDGAVDHVAVVELDDGVGDRVLEGHAAEVVLDDGAGDVVAGLGEGAEGRFGDGGVGQGNRFRSVDRSTVSVSGGRSTSSFRDRARASAGGGGPRAGTRRCRRSASAAAYRPGSTEWTASGCRPASTAAWRSSAGV